MTSMMYESGTTYFLGEGRRDPTPAKMVMPFSPVAASEVVAAAKAVAMVANGKIDSAAKEKVGVGNSRDETVNAPTS